LLQLEKRFDGPGAFDINMFNKKNHDE
jgi:hypothetical protein